MNKDNYGLKKFIVPVQFVLECEVEAQTEETARDGWDCAMKFLLEKRFPKNMGYKIADCKLVEK